MVTTGVSRRAACDVLVWSQVTPAAGPIRRRIWRAGVGVSAGPEELGRADSIPASALDVVKSEGVETLGDASFPRG